MKIEEKTFCDLNCCSFVSYEHPRVGYEAVINAFLFSSTPDTFSMTNEKYLGIFIKIFLYMKLISFRHQ